MEADRYVAAAAGLYIQAELSFYSCLTLAARLRAATDADKERYAALFAGHRDKLASWAEGCPENFRRKLLLASAEIARARGDEAAAIDLYEQAIGAAKESGIGRDEALANEIAASYRLGKGRMKIARTYMTDAYYGYLQWGATTMVEAIVEAHPALLLETALLRPAPGETRAINPAHLVPVKPSIVDEQVGRARSGAW